MLDYETLKIIWWGVMALLILGFALTDGYNLGVVMLFPLVARSDDERRVLINTIGPHWEGHQVWLVTAAGAAFAAWPILYATAFSGLYVALLLVLLSLILRPVGFDFRSKVPDGRWRQFWDSALFLGAVLSVMIFGVVIGNLFLGLPFSFDADQRLAFHGGFPDLLNPFGLFVGVLSIALFAMHGAAYLQLRTVEDIKRAAQRASLLAGIAVVVLFSLGGIWLWTLQGHSMVNVGAWSDSLLPQDKTVALIEHAWYGNFIVAPWLWAFPALGVLGGIGTMFASRQRRSWAAFLASSVAVIGIVCSAAAALFPFLLPSSSEPSHGLTAWDAGSSPLTMQALLIAVVIFLPIVIAYTGWAMRAMRGPTTLESVAEDSKHLN